MLPADSFQESRTDVELPSSSIDWLVEELRNGGYLSVLLLLSLQLTCRALRTMSSLLLSTHHQ